MIYLVIPFMLGLLSFGAALLTQVRGTVRLSILLYLLSLLCTLVLAWCGMDFSPSFTAMFLVVCLVLYVLSELCRLRETTMEEKTSLFSCLKYLFSIVGTLLVFPSVFIYAAGDDMLTRCTVIALAVSVVLHCAVYILQYRCKSRKMGAACAVENWLLLSGVLVRQ